MNIIRPGTNYDFIGKSRIFIPISAILVLLSLIAVLAGGLVFGVDFRGGSDIIISLPPGSQVTQADITQILREREYRSPSVQAYGDQGGFLIRLSEISSLSEETVKKFEAAIQGKGPGGTSPDIRYDKTTLDKIQLAFSEPVDPGIVIEALKAAGLEEKKDYTLRGRAEEGMTYVEGDPSRSFQILPTGIASEVVTQLSGALGTEVELQNATSVGPKAGEQLRNDGIKSVTFAMLLIMLFIALRFDFRYAPGAVLAILHDVTIAAGVFVLFRIEFNLPAIAALLTITGYSVNDTIVVYDRMRELSARHKDKPLAEIANRAINEMLGRTLLTSLTTLLAITSLLVLGGGQIRGFAVALFTGVVVGTYSSIYVAAPLVLWMDRWLKERGIDDGQETAPSGASSSGAGRASARRTTRARK